MSTSLEKTSITFGKYKGTTLSRVLRDQDYCKWLLEQEWFQSNYEFLYNRVKEYKPESYFLNLQEGEELSFAVSYEYFNLTPPEHLQIELNSVDMTCYNWYFCFLNKIKEDIYERMENDEENPYDIKAPTGWLKCFEKTHGIPRTDLKEFLKAYNLLNIPYIIERIKKEGGIEYKGAESFNIAKARSKLQENFWEDLLNSRYGEDLCTQFKYEKCIFDFINISTKTIFECKLGLKDFDEAQHNKYRIALKEYRIIYLICNDCVIDIEKKCIYTSNPDKYQQNISVINSTNWFYTIIQDFDLVEVEDLSSLFGNK